MDFNVPRKISQNLCDTFKGIQRKKHSHEDCCYGLVSSSGRDSRDLRSSRLAEATQKALGTNAL